MAKEFNRSRRVAKEVKKEIAIILKRKIRDPRISVMTTISDVEMSCDLSYAKVFVTFLNDQEEIVRSNIRALQNASHFIRSLLGNRIRLRILPELIFFHDNSLLDGIRISYLLNNRIKYIKSHE